ncbi:MAG: hypothetical protein MN733_17215 [Nitrososphaera sp.]|nr:hypothetical protein [Nitrososphaera sp.]
MKEDLVAVILANPSTSVWLRQSLTSALARDPVDAANDAADLAMALDSWCETRLLATESNGLWESGREHA